jgi:RNA polymerase-binding transcription factor DksA
MAKKPRDQQRTDARRIARRGTGKLDATTPAPPRGGSPEQSDVPTLDAIRDRLLTQRHEAIAELARLGFSPERDDSTGTGESPFEEGDVAQASERLDMSFVHRERIADRINRLTRALEHLARGNYGTCEVCGRPIEPARLAAAPEVTVCRECQEQRERNREAA